MRKQTVGWMGVGVAALLLVIVAPAQAAYEFYLSIDGTKQGKFRGESLRKGTEGKIPGLRFQYTVQSPRDMATGQASGKRQHQPVVITKRWGVSSPQIFQACVTNELLKSVVLEFVRTNPNGQEYIYHVIRLTNATISSIRQYANMLNANELPTIGGQHDLEDVSFTFQKIEIFNNDGKTQALDDWTK